MKNLASRSLFVFVILNFAFSTIFSQAHWTKDTLNNPVLEPGPPGAWDSEWLFCSGVLFDSSIYKMWYTGYDSINLSIGYASSLDGINWTKLPNPVLEGDSNTWAQAVGNASVINDGFIYHMWFRGDSANTHGIGYATSPDGIVWTKNPNPVLDVGVPGSWDGAWVLEPKVIFDNVTFRMWYTGWDGVGTPSIGYATSPDAITWTKYDDPSTLNPPFAESDPVMNPGQPGSWDVATVNSPAVYYDGTVHHMWYTGGDTLFPSTPWASAGKIGYASSPDGITWTKFNKPVLEPGTGSDWDNVTLGGGDVIYYNNNYQMWYTGGGWDGTFHYRIGYATAPRNPGIINIPNDYPTIQAGINAAIDGDTVLVTDSTYYENINFMGKAITVASHFLIDGDSTHIDSTIIDGSQPSHPDTGSVVIFVSGEDTNSVLSGFTITNGTGTISSYAGYAGRYGGGIFCYNSGGQFESNKIMNNSVTNDDVNGGGIGVVSTLNVVVNIVNNEIKNNTLTCTSTANDQGAYGGGILFINSSGKIKGNRINSNSSICIDSTGGCPAYGGGIHLYSDITPRSEVLVLENVISQNSLQGTDVFFIWGAIGAGISVWDVKAVIKNNFITENEINNTPKVSQGIGLCLSYVDYSVVEGNYFFQNKSSQTLTRGGGIALFNCTNSTIRKNTIKQNGVTLGGGGMYIRNSDQNIKADANIIENNNADSGGGILMYDSNPKLENNIIRCNNVINYGAGIYTDDNSNPQIINNTIAFNIANGNGGGICNAGNSISRVLNCIIWENQAQQFPSIQEYSGTVYADYSDIQGGWSGTGNINADPLFADSLIFELSQNSPCVGAGTDSLAPPFDYDGDPRPNPIDEYVDIGAQESDFLTGIIKGELDYLPKTFSLKQNYPNPFNPRTTIEFSIPKTEFVKLKIYNLLGQEITTLVSEKLTPGEYKYTWDASQLASGMYFYKLETESYNSAKKLILLR